MKILYLVRHAKSDWGNENISDIDRPLNNRGYRDAHLMSSLMKEKKIHPDLIISSPAVRAVSTALVFCRNLNLSYSDILINHNLYQTTLKQYVEIVTQFDNRFNTIMLFAHNPVISDLANFLTAPVMESMPTCCVTGIRPQADCNDWKNFSGQKGELFFYDLPKNHNGIR